MKEQIVTGKKFKILADVTSRLWHVISFWTKAQDVEFNSGQNAQTTLGNITGISDSLTSTSSNVAASSKAIKVLNDKIVNQIGNLNGQISQKDQTINNLNNQINQKNQQIEDLNGQLNNTNVVNGLLGGEATLHVNGSSTGGGVLDASGNFYANVMIISSGDIVQVKNTNLRLSGDDAYDAYITLNGSNIVQMGTRSLNLYNNIFQVAPGSEIYIQANAEYDESNAWGNSSGNNQEYDVFINGPITKIHADGGVDIKGGSNKDDSVDAIMEFTINNRSRIYKSISIQNIVFEPRRGEHLSVNGVNYINGGTIDVSGMDEITITGRSSVNDNDAAIRYDVFLYQ